MKLYEYAAKEILSKYDIPVPEGALATNPDEAAEIVKRMGYSVIKAQVLSGGRGKAGGIAVVSSIEEAKREAARILDLTIKGLPVKKLLLEKDKKPQKEMYLGITVDRSARRPVIMASTEGGIDIEETSRSAPEKILKIHINPLTGLHDYQVRRLSNFMDAERSASIAAIIKKLYRIFIDNDCLLVEINPLANTQDGIIALDARMVIDDNALFRHDLVEEETGSLEELAGKHGMSYVELDGNIGCIVNGAGLAMATLDMIKMNGGSPANFMDVRAGANQEQMKTALKIISSNRKVSAIIVNIFGGLTKCDEVARAIIEMSTEINKPFVIRLAGTNEKEGRSILEKQGMTMAGSTEEAAKEAVELERSNR